MFLFVCFFSSHLKCFHPFGDVTITDKMLLILTYMYAQHSWPLSSEGSWTCHTYCDMGQPFIMAISEDPWSGAVTTYFNNLGLSWLGFLHPTYSLWGEDSIGLRHHHGCVNSTSLHVNVHITQIGIGINKVLYHSLLDTYRKWAVQRRYGVREDKRNSWQRKFGWWYCCLER